MQPKTKCNERLSRPISTPKPTIHAVFASTPTASSTPTSPTSTTTSSPTRVAIFQLDPSKPTRALERGNCPTPAVFSTYNLTPIGWSTFATESTSTSTSSAKPTSATFPTAHSEPFSAPCTTIWCGSNSAWTSPFAYFAASAWPN